MPIRIEPATTGRLARYSAGERAAHRVHAVLIDRDESRPRRAIAAAGTVDLFRRQLHVHTTFEQDRTFRAELACDSEPMR